MEYPFYNVTVKHIEFIQEYAFGKPMEVIMEIMKIDQLDVLEIKKDLGGFLYTECDFELIKKSYESRLFSPNDQFKKYWRDTAFGIATNAYFFCDRYSYLKGYDLEQLYRKSLYVTMKMVFKPCQ